MSVHLREDFAQAWKGRDPFAEADALQGQVFRNVKGRRTLQFEFQGRNYFVKIHHGIGWSEIFKNLLMMRKPIADAENEWLAIERLTQLGVATMKAVAFGLRGLNPARRMSFIVTEALENTISLEDYCARWGQKRLPLAHKLRLLDALVSISRTLHENGICHRDYYLCHFLLHLSLIHI